MYLTILDSIDSQNINKLKINKISPRRHHPIPLDQVHNWFKRGLTIIWTRSRFTPWTWSNANLDEVLATFGLGHILPLGPGPPHVPSRVFWGILPGPGPTPIL